MGFGNVKWWGGTSLEGCVPSRFFLCLPDVSVSCDPEPAGMLSRSCCCVYIEPGWSRTSCLPGSRPLSPSEIERQHEVFRMHVQLFPQSLQVQRVQRRVAAGDADDRCQVRDKFSGRPQIHVTIAPHTNTYLATLRARRQDTLLYLSIHTLLSLCSAARLQAPHIKGSLLLVYRTETISRRIAVRLSFCAGACRRVVRGII